MSLISSREARKCIFHTCFASHDEINGIFIPKFEYSLYMLFIKVRQAFLLKLLLFYLHVNFGVYARILVTI